MNEQTVEAVTHGWKQSYGVKYCQGDGIRTLRRHDVMQLRTGLKPERKSVPAVPSRGRKDNIKTDLQTNAAC